MTRFALAAGAAFACIAAPACAQELFGGVYAHDVNWVTRSGIEHGTDFELGVRGARLHALDFIGAPRPQAFVSVNSAGQTHFAAAGFSWQIGGRVYLRPGIGVAVHTGPSSFDPANRRIYFGSRVLFEPEIGIGVKLAPRTSVEASWVHLSHAQIFSGQNPGLDTVGVRFNLAFR
ncbi:MAG: acyloxyacyl hydrolase [Alphaproteobacteria bacterium]|nr:acyloxyacyl hydrolase [Alphaproteobacteria bacterium]